MAPEDRIKTTPDLAFFNSRSRVAHREDEERLVFYFNYAKQSSTTTGARQPLLNNSGTEEVIDWKVLRELKQSRKWGVLRHPMILNYINEKLLSCTLFYTLHICAFFSFLLLLSYHIFNRNTFLDFIITGFLAIFLLFMLMKGTMRVQVTKSTSLWFCLAFVFNLLAYIATFLYVWARVLFSYDNYHQELKHMILWFLPIVAVISAWVNFLYILRKSPYGIYIFMMTRILKSFGHIATIWIPTLIAFSFAFHLVMRDSGTDPWESIDKNENTTVIQKLFIILQAVTKTSTMMIGEVDANDILGTKQWIPSILVLVFEIITVILLMNLMVSLAVGDVCDLRNCAQEKILKIKVNFVIEALQLSEVFAQPFRFLIPPLHEQRTNNVLVVDSDGSYHTRFESFDIFKTADLPTIGEKAPKSYQARFEEPRMRVRIVPITDSGRGSKFYNIQLLLMNVDQGLTRSVMFKKCSLQLTETADSGIPQYTDPEATNYENTDGLWRRYGKWLIGLNWSGYLDF